ncbi:MAG TPA: F0F1 ATP synthase subunit epsilon [Terriglobia bacterium]|jgi:F-type H+-transporting ATPase subunit epsilon|nr:F0F1 ATP synthase subunit epsilon [Terriglobia bacterium]
MADTIPDQINLELVTPDRLMIRDAVLAVSLPGREGYLGILPGHAPLLSELKPGQVSYTQGKVTHYLFVNWGFVEVLPDRVIVLVEGSERPEEIDVARAKRSRERAEELLRRAGAGEAEIDALRARAALERAMARIEVAERASQRTGVES